MAPRKGQAKRSTTKKTTKSKAGPKSSAVTKKPATRKQPSHKTKPTSAVGDGDDDDDDEIEDDADREASPPRRRKKLTRKRRAPSDEDQDADDIGGAAPIPAAAPIRRSKRRKASESPGPDVAAEQEQGDQPAAGDGAHPPASNGGAGTAGEVPEPEVQAEEAAPAADGGPTIDTDNPWDIIDPLATSQAEANHIDVARGIDARVTVELKVFQDTGGYTSRLGYSARMMLNGTVRNNAGEDEEVNEVIGIMDAWRISKPRARLPNVDPTWLQEILGKEGKRQDINETCLCMRALFTYAGAGRSGLGVTPLALNNHSLIFIQLIRIARRFQGKRLMGPFWTCFYEELSRLPEWYAFEGHIVLVPGRPVGEAGEEWGPDTPEVNDRAERRLTVAYGRQGFVIWARNKEVLNSLIGVDPDAKRVRLTVMGLTIPLPAARAAPPLAPAAGHSGGASLS